MRSTSMLSRPARPGATASDGAAYRGRFSDGRTAASHAVGVRLANGQIVIEGAEEREGAAGGVRAWPLARVETGEPVGRASGDVLIHEPGRAGATLFVADPQFVRELARLAPRVTGASQRWRSVKPFLLLTALASGIAGLLAAIDYSPARAIAGLIPQSTRAVLGQQVVRSMVGVGEVCVAPAGVAALEKLSVKLSAASGSQRSFKVTVVDSPVVNAFAAPGEVIVLMRGALAQASGPDEIAGILAHEMGHGIELHPEAGIVRGLGLAVAGEMILGGTAGGSLANIGIVLANLSYSRSAEREADQHALSILKGADISPEGLAKFFERMGKRERALGGGDGSLSGGDFLRTHPSTAERLARVKAAAAYKGNPALDATEWAALKDICPRSPAAQPLPRPGDGREPGPAKPAPRKGGDGNQRSKRDV